MASDLSVNQVPAEREFVPAKSKLTRTQGIAPMRIELSKSILTSIEEKNAVQSI